MSSCLPCHRWAARLRQQHGRPQTRHGRHRRIAAAAEQAVRGRIDGPGIACACCPRRSSTRSQRDEQLRIRQGIAGLQRRKASSAGRGPSRRRRTRSRSRNWPPRTRRPGRHLAPAGGRSGSSSLQTETRQVLAVHERVRETAAGQEPGDVVPVAGLRGPVDRVAEVAAALEPGRRTLLQLADGLALLPLQQVAKDLREQLVVAVAILGGIERYDERVGSRARPTSMSPHPVMPVTASASGPVTSSRKLVSISSLRCGSGW